MYFVNVPVTILRVFACLGSWICTWKSLKEVKMICRAIMCVSKTIIKLLEKRQWKILVIQCVKTYIKQENDVYTKVILNYQNHRVQYWVFGHVLEGDFSLRRALQIQICVVEPCCRHVKHSLNSKKYASEKIMVIRCVVSNIKQENDVLSQKGDSKKAPCIGL